MPRRIQSSKRVEKIGTRADGGLPRSPEAFRRELARRLFLLDREVESLDPEVAPPASRSAVESLWRIRDELSERIARRVDAEAWVDFRNETIDIWRRYRREFERLAVVWQRRVLVRPGQSERGPKW